MAYLSTRGLIKLLMTASLAGIVAAATAQTPPPKRPTVDLSAEASHPAPNDQIRATIFYETENKDPAALAKQVNSVVDKALNHIRQQPGIDARTSSVSTYPNYRKEKVDGWRMRTEIQLESHDIPAVSRLLDSLQQNFNMSIAGINMQPTPQTRSDAADVAATAAIRAFEARAASVAKTLDRQYRIQRLSINYGNTVAPPYPVMYEASLMAKSSAVPLQSGNTDITVTVSGTIELLN